mgnify:FL=1|tara:strand:- start:305 stop:1129 length:825 start_codon:yes stop_codon:yes gene_type:complete
MSVYKNNNFDKKGNFNKGSSSIEQFESLMANSTHTDQAKVRLIIEKLFAELSKNIDKISDRQQFNITISAKIDGGEQQFRLFLDAAKTILHKQEITEYTFGHDGGDGFYNPYSGDMKSVSLGRRGDSITKISFFHRPLSPDCPCCHDRRDVRKEGDNGYRCSSSNCNLSFKIDCNLKSYFGGEYPNCEICNDSEDVYWMGDDEGCGDCNENFDDDKDGYGCGPFKCGECGHRIDTGGSCVDPECNCEDWDDDDDDDDDDDCCDDCGEEWDYCDC